MSDPWLLTRPTLLCVSGGRSSMRMLWEFLNRHDGKLPEFAVPVFNNTGKEDPRALDFVHRCEVEWSCPIVWLEYQDAELPADRWKVVNHNSASRNGEPYEAVIRRKKFLPNPVTRFCTTELKVHLSHRWARAAWPYGKGKYVRAIGLRADAPDDARVRRAKVRCASGKVPWDLVFPLHDAGITKPQVNGWWSRQPFDLGIPDRCGNCDLCFLKARHKLAANIEEDPSRTDWWIAQEEWAGGTFRPRNRSYASFKSIRELALSDAPKSWKQEDMFNGFDLLDIECACTD